MRDIKFRYTFRRKSDNHIIQDLAPIECLEGKGDVPYVLCVDPGIWELIGRDEYTGLKDKNGVEIYEGDIINGDLLRDDGGWIGQVFWGPHTGGWMVGDKNRSIVLYYYIKKDIEVIGNIYENEDLLK